MSSCLRGAEFCDFRCPVFYLIPSFREPKCFGSSKLFSTYKDLNLSKEYNFVSYITNLYTRVAIRTHNVTNIFWQFCYFSVFCRKVKYESLFFESTHAKHPFDIFAFDRMLRFFSDFLLHLGFAICREIVVNYSWSVGNTAVCITINQGRDPFFVIFYQSSNVVLRFERLTPEIYISGRQSRIPIQVITIRPSIFRMCSLIDKFQKHSFIKYLKCECGPMYLIEGPLLYFIAGPFCTLSLDPLCTL